MRNVPQRRVQPAGDLNRAKSKLSVSLRREMQSQRGQGGEANCLGSVATKPGTMTGVAVVLQDVDDCAHRDQARVHLGWQVLAVREVWTVRNLTENGGECSEIKVRQNTKTHPTKTSADIPQTSLSSPLRLWPSSLATLRRSTELVLVPPPVVVIDRSVHKAQPAHLAGTQRYDGIL
ncbi:hypothetical protein BC628DRAFT_120067 [Trametes gibbosa]|nr:hypothetical protein BC628DRAFT_120067 [Trametes gibbosa]